MSAIRRLWTAGKTYAGIYFPRRRRPHVGTPSPTCSISIPLLLPSHCEKCRKDWPDQIIDQHFLMLAPHLQTIVSDLKRSCAILVTPLKVRRIVGFAACRRKRRHKDRATPTAVYVHSFAHNEQIGHGTRREQPISVLVQDLVTYFDEAPQLPHHLGKHFHLDAGRGLFVFFCFFCFLKGRLR